MIKMKIRKQEKKILMPDKREGWIRKKIGRKGVGQSTTRKQKDSLAMVLRCVE